MRRILGLVLVGVLAAACTDSPEEEDLTDTTIPEAASVLGVAAGDWPECLNPLLCTGDAAAELVYQHVLPRLLEVDHEGRYIPSPVLSGRPVTEVDDASGQQRIVYRIAPDARWHDGRPVTSTDVKATWMARMHTPGVATGLDRAVVDVDDRDPLEAVVTLGAPHANWREFLGGHSGWLLQADALGDDTDLTGQFIDELPFGAGAFELLSVGEERIVLAARPEHWDVDRQPRVDRVQIERIGPDEDLPSGIDVVLPGVGADEFPAELARRIAPTTTVVGLFFDERTPALSDAAVRHAIDLGIDRRDLLGLVTTGEERPALVTCLGWLPSDEACGEHLTEADEDVVAADALLAQAGWVVTETGERAGPFGVLATPVTYDASIDGALAVAEAVRLRLTAMGVAVTEQRAVAAGEWRRRGREEGTGVGVFAVELGTPGRVADLYSCRDQTLNRMAWCPAEVMGLLDELRRTIDDEARRPVAVAISELAARSFAWLPLHQRTEEWLVAEERVSVPSRQPLGAGPLGALHRFAREGD